MEDNSADAVDGGTRLQPAVPLLSFDSQDSCGYVYGAPPPTHCASLATNVSYQRLRSSALTRQTVVWLRVRHVHSNAFHHKFVFCAHCVVLWGLLDGVTKTLKAREYGIGSSRGGGAVCAGRHYGGDANRLRVRRRGRG
jgi:hypothetical protein